MTKRIDDELPDATRAWLERLGFVITDNRLWVEALTHGSVNSTSDTVRKRGAAEAGTRDYQRLEFLGDRVLGLSIASWLYERSGDSQEGVLSQRLNALVSGATCARIARAIGVPDHIRLGKQAREDGGADSTNILGDVMEALIGASYLESGFDTARAAVLSLWDGELAGAAGRSKHPKSALQEWAAGNAHAMPRYEVTNRSGPDHAARFTVEVSVHSVGAAQADATSKGEAERLAAKAFLEKFG